MDLQTTEGDGLAVGKLARRHRRTSGLPLVVLGRTPRRRHGTIDVKANRTADGQGLEGRARILVTRAVKIIHPAVDAVASNLAEIDRILIVRISPGLLRASSETTGGIVENPVTTPGHPTAIGISLILDLDLRELQFYEITSAARGYGGRMVDAVLRDLPAGWNGVVLMDWSSGFWKRMGERHGNLVVR